MAAQRKLWLSLAFLAALIVGLLAWSTPSLMAGYGFARLRETLAAAPQPSPAQLVADMAWLQRAGEAATLRALLRDLASDARDDRMAALMVAHCWGLIQGPMQAGPAQIVVWPALQPAAPEIGRALESEDPELCLQAILASQALPAPAPLLPQLRELAADSSRVEVQRQAALGLERIEARR